MQLWIKLCFSLLLSPTPGKPQAPCLEELSDSTGPLLHIQHRYDPLGRLLESETRRPSGALRKREVYSYDEQGRLESKRWFAADERMLRREIYEYDHAGHRLQRLRFDAKGASKGRQEYRYKGDLKISEASYMPDGTPELRQQLRYDQEGRQVERRFEGLIPLTKPHDGLERSEYEGGRLMRKLFYGPGGQLKQSRRYRYNAQGREESQEELDATGQP